MKCPFCPMAATNSHPIRRRDYEVETNVTVVQTDIKIGAF